MKRPSRWNPLPAIALFSLWGSPAPDADATERIEAGPVHLTCVDRPLQALSPRNAVPPEAATLRWSGVPHASGYRVQVRLSHPEGLTLRSLDIQTTSTELRLQPLPEGETINVQALVGAGCNDRSMDDLLATEPLFTVRQRPVCDLGALELRWLATRLTWPALSQAQAYRVRVVQAPAPDLNPALDNGTLPPALNDLMPPQTTASASIDLAALGALPANVKKTVLLVQPVCQGRPGTLRGALMPPMADSSSTR